MADHSDEKKTGDLTALKDLAQTENASFSISLENDAPPALEGLEDLMSPMSPALGGVDPGSSSFTFSADPNAPAESLTDLNEAALLDPIANLPPIDADTLAAASGADSLPDLAPDQDSLPRAIATPLGAAIATALSTSASSMDAVRNYSDHIAAAAGPESAETPYSLLIQGHLRPHEKETLLSILSRENLGIREVELEPQFSSDQILIPRISEYVGVMIVQALRNTMARIRLGPSERIFVSKEADDRDRLILHPNADAEVLITEEGTDRVETMILTSADTVPGRKLLQAIDTLHNSMNLKSVSLAQPQSPLFLDAIERLKTQLKLQAHHRGANALVGFKYTLHPMEGQTMHKLVVEARAVRVENSRP